MAFQISDYYDLVELLRQKPEWREELRQLLLTPEVLTLPQAVRELVEAQKRTDEQLRLLTQRVDELAEAQKRTDEQLRLLTQRVDALTQRVDALTQRVDALAQRVDALAQRVDELTEAQKRTDEQLRLLTQRVDTLTKRMDELAEAQKRTEQRLNRLSGEVGNLRGEVLEVRYHQRPFSFFGRLVSRAKVVDLQELWPLLETRLPTEALEEMLLLDMLVQGQLRPSLMETAGVTEVWLAVEISGVIDANDVKRVYQRAALLRQAGLNALPVAAGNEWTKEAETEAKQLGVILQSNGTIEYQEIALQKLRNTGQNPA